MTTYKNIRGTHITTVTTDPPSPVNGQMWYNSTTKIMKGFKSNPAGGWATATSMNTGRWGGGASSVSPQTAILVATGSNTVNVEQYNGSSWTEVANVNEKRYGVWGTGTNTSMLVFGGNVPGSSPTASGDRKTNESWNGSSWTEVADLNVVKRYPGGSGSSNTNSLCFGSYNGTATVAATETWNGSSWTEVGDLNSAKSSVCGTGADNTAALCVGGNVSGGDNGSAETETWNGSSWTEVADLNTRRRDLGGAGTNTLSVVFGGLTPSPNTWNAVTETWNGTAWTEVSDMSTAREITGQASGSTSAAIACGGMNAPGSVLTTVEEFTSPATSTVTFTTS